MLTGNDIVAYELRDASDNVVFFGIDLVRNVVVLNGQHLELTPCLQKLPDDTTVHFRFRSPGEKEDEYCVGTAGSIREILNGHPPDWEFIIDMKL